MGAGRRCILPPIAATRSTVSSPESRVVRAVLDAPPLLPIVSNGMMGTRCCWISEHSHDPGMLWVFRMIVGRTTRGF